MDAFKHIVLLSPSATLGGAELCLLDIVKASKLAPQSVKFSVILLQDGPLENELKHLGVSSYVLPLPDKLKQLGDSGSNKLSLALNLILTAPASLFYVKRLRELIQNLQPDIVHSNGMKTHLLSALARLKEIQIIWHIRDYISGRKLMPLLLKWWASVPDQVLAISQSIADDCRKTFPPDRVHLFYDGIDTLNYSPEGDTVDFGSSLNIGMVATYARWKGQDLFIKMAKEVLNKLPDEKLNFIIVGGPIYQTVGSQFSKQELENLVFEAGLVGKVQFKDFTANTPAVYRGLDIVVHASTKLEPFGRSIAEAMACARATIVPNCGGSGEIIEAGFSAMGYEISNVSDLSAQVIKLIQEPELRKKISVNARKRVLSQFSLPQISENLCKAYQLSETNPASAHERSAIG